MSVLAVSLLGVGSTGLSAHLGGVVDTATIAGAISAFVPPVVSFITKREASDRVKAVTNLLAVAVASVIALFINGSDVPITWHLVSTTFIAGLVVSVATYKSVWKPLKVTTAIANATPNVGVGTPVPSVIETARPGTGGAQND